MEALLDIIEALKKELTVVTTAALPLIELKGAIPVGLSLGLDRWTTFFCAYAGSLLPVPFLLLFLKPIMAFLRKTKVLGWLADWIDNRSRKKSASVRKYSLLGLFLFVAVPLPTTGVWTGAMIASVLDLRVKHAFPIIALGNLTAGVIVMFVSHQFI